MTYVYLAVEDRLSEAVGTRLLQEYLGAEVGITVLSKGGFGYLKSKMQNFVDIARRNFVLLITDLDAALCAPSLRATWLAGTEAPETFAFRIAVREIEAWVMADRAAFAEFLGIPAARVSTNVEALGDPKAELLRLARSGSRAVKAALLPPSHARAKVGLGYNDALVGFVNSSWNSERASQNSDSLVRARRSLKLLADRGNK